MLKKLKMNKSLDSKVKPYRIPLFIDRSNSLQKYLWEQVNKFVTIWISHLIIECNSASADGHLSTGLWQKFNKFTAIDNSLLLGREKSKACLFINSYYLEKSKSSSRLNLANLIDRNSASFISIVLSVVGYFCCGRIIVGKSQMCRISCLCLYILINLKNL